MYDKFKIPVTEQNQPWFKCWKRIVKILLKDVDPETIYPLIKILCEDRDLYNWKSIKKVTEYALKNAINAKQIFSRISKRIKTGSHENNNNVINQMFAELRVIPLLTQLGFTSITYKREDSVDFVAQLNSKNFHIEVSFLGGKNFSGQDVDEQRSYLSGYTVYDLDVIVLLKKLSNKYREKEEQVLKYSDGNDSIIILCTHREEVDPFWFQHKEAFGVHPIQSFVNNCKISTIVFGPGSILYVSEKLNNILLPFDRARYIERAYGINLDEIKKQSLVIKN